jgi:hypothetical protein
METVNNRTGKWNWGNNCFGYAVNIPKWLLVGDYTQGDTHDYTSHLDFILDKGYERFNLKPVSKKDMVLGKTYVAYRYCANDFHFMKRLPTGHWRHKQGGSPVAAISQKNVLNDGWVREDGVVYNSKLYLFEVME